MGRIVSAARSRGKRCVGAGVNSMCLGDCLPDGGRGDIAGAGVVHRRAFVATIVGGDGFEHASSQGETATVEANHHWIVVGHHFDGESFAQAHASQGADGIGVRVDADDSRLCASS